VDESHDGLKLLVGWTQPNADSNNITSDFKNRIFEMVCSMILKIHQHPTADYNIPALKRFAGNYVTKKIDAYVKSRYRRGSRKVKIKERGMSATQILGFLRCRQNSASADWTTCQ